MKLEFLGTGAADHHLEGDLRSKDVRRYSSALLDGKILFDPGPHIFNYMETFKKPDLFDNLEHVLITHSHGDHINMDCVKRIHEMHPDCRFYGSEATARSFWKTGIPFTAILPYYDYKIGDYWVTPLRSTHEGWEDELTYVYSVLDKGGKKIFYATDTALPPQQTINYIYRRGYDLFVMELTAGDRHQAPFLGAHMSIPLLKEFLSWLDYKDRRPLTIKESGKFLVTHLSKGWHKSHDELTEQLKPLGVEPAYDGLIVEV